MIEPCGDKCKIQYCLYGKGDLIIGIGPEIIGQTKYPKVIKRVALCRNCGKTNKIVQCWKDGKFKEMIKRCDVYEYADCFQEKWNNQENMPIDKEVNEAIEKKRRELECKGN